MDVTANFYRHAAGAASDGIDIPAGQHIWNVRIADLAGNLASNLVTFTATGQTNADAPVISNVNIGGDGMTILPASSEVWVQGKVSGTSTDTTVAASINGGEPILMNQRGEDFGAMLPLASGTNVIVLVATSTTPQPAQQSRRRRQYDRDSDGPASKTNQSSVLLPVKPSDFHIWEITPELGTFCDGHPQTVAGSMDMTFEGVAITNATINGQAALGWRYDDGSTAYYHISATVPCPDTSEMTLKITVYLADGRQITMPFWYLEGYRIASKIEHYQNTAPHNNTCSSAPNYYANFYWEENFTPQPLDGKWQVTAFVMLDATNHYVAMTNSVTATNWAAYSQEYLTATNLVDDPPSVEEITTNHWAARAPWSCGLGNMIPTGSHDSRYLWPWEVNGGLRFGTNNYYSEVTYNYPFGGCNPVKTQKMHSQIWVADAGEMVVNWPLHYPTNQQVLLTFEHMEYSRLNGEAYDPTQILYHGQPPDVIETNWDGNYNLGYIVSISGSSFTLNQDAFSWPTSTINISGTGADPGGCWTSSGGTYGSAHHLGFASFHNCALGITSPIGSPVASNGGIGWNSTTARFDFQGVSKAAINYYSLTITARDCAEWQNKFTWDFDNNALGTIEGHTANPTHVPPATVDPAAPATGNIRLNATITHPIQVFRDHLARDVANFTGIQNKKGTWVTPFGSIEMDHDWICWGSVQHAYNGKYGTQNQTKLSLHQVIDGWPHVGGYVNYPITNNPDAQPAINNLRRGDVVVITSSGVEVHAVIMTSTMTDTIKRVWAANNGGLYDPDYFAVQKLDDVLGNWKFMTGDCKFMIFKRP